MLDDVTATRYATPLREGGSLPGLVEADDLGTYVAKFTGAGQGRKALVAEVVAGELARSLGLRVPSLVTLRLDPVIGRGEPDEEVQNLLKASGGLNLGMDYLPRSLGFDPLAFRVDPGEAGRVVWFDAFVDNVDRSWRNPNLLLWHGELWLIDHGATLIWQHDLDNAARLVCRRYDASDHALARFTPDLAAADAELAPNVTDELLHEVLALVPDTWLVDEAAGDPMACGTRNEADRLRQRYVEILSVRRDARADWLPTLPAPDEVADRQRPASGGSPDPRPDWVAERLGRKREAR